MELLFQNHGNIMTLLLNSRLFTISIQLKWLEINVKIWYMGRFISCNLHSKRIVEPTRKKLTSIGNTQIKIIHEASSVPCRKLDLRNCSYNDIHKKKRRKKRGKFCQTFVFFIWQMCDLLSAHTDQRNNLTGSAPVSCLCSVLEIN